MIRDNRIQIRRETHPWVCRERGLSESVPPPRKRRRLGNAWTRRSWRSRTALCSRRRQSPRWWWRRPRLRIGHVSLHEKGWEREHPVGSWKSSHHPSICRRPTSARAARWWRRGVAAIAASALATRDSARILPSPRCSVDLEARFRLRRRARCWLPPGIFGERSTATRRTDQYHSLEFPSGLLLLFWAIFQIGDAIVTWALERSLSVRHLNDRLL